MNVVRDENMKLRTKLQQGENELQRKDREIKELLNKLQSPSLGTYIKEIHGKKIKSNEHLIMALKKKVQDIQKENKFLKEGFITLKKSVKVTATQELDSELKTYADECVRLRKVIDEMTAEKQYLSPESMEKIEEKIQDQNQQITGIKQENNELTAQLQKLETDLKKAKLKAEEKKQAPERKDTSKQQVIIKEQMKEIQNLKDQIEAAKKSSKKEQQAEELKKVKVALSKQLVEKDDEIRTLGMKLVEIKRAKDTEIKALKDQIKESKIIRTNIEQ